MTNLQRFRAQLDGLCRKVPTLPQRVLTGIDKHQAEMDEAKTMWAELEKDK